MQTEMKQRDTEAFRFIPLDPKREEIPTDRTRVKLRVQCATNGLVIGSAVGAYTLYVGTHEIIVTADEVPRIQALVETEEGLLAQSIALFDSEIARDVAKRVAELRAGQGEDLTDAEVRTARRRVLEETNESWPRKFKQLHPDHRDPLPLRSCEVVEQLPAMVDERRMASESAQASAIAAAVAKAVAEALGDMKGKSK